MKIFKYFLLIIFFLIGSNFVNAQNLPIPIDKIPDKIILTSNQVSYDLPREEILKWIDEKNELIYSKKYLSEIENVNFCAYKKSLFCRITFPYENQYHFQNVSTQIINKDSIQDYIKNLATKIDQEAQNAKLTIENEKVSLFSLPKDGLKLNEEKSLELIEKYMLKGNYSEILDLPFEIIKPEISSDSVENLGIKEIVGEGRSNFKGSPKNRIFNIKVATERFNGALIKPGEDFSFVKVLGAVDGEHGYLPELVIKHDKTEPEFGGGICQVSTTAFRAALNTGLKITARRNHAYPVSYYSPQGMDSTVYIPKPDLSFINDTPNHILIQTKIEGTELTFTFYGTSDGRKVNLIGPKVTERKPDGSMKTTLTQQIFDKNDQLIREEIFKSAYASPDKYPHPGQENKLTQKPKNWSSNEWNEYKKANKM